MKTNLYLEAPNYHKPGEINFHNTNNIFLASSISGAHDWQKNVAEKLLPHFNVFNPRRKNYKTLDPDEERAQITWEYIFLSKIDTILFYFSNETVAPITLFEFGKVLGRIKYANWQKIYVCIHPDYSRKNDLIIQTELERPELLKNFYSDLDEMIEAIIKQR